MRVYIVDDEVHIRQRLFNKIDWQLLGIDEVLLFDDGDLAEEAFSDNLPDIILTDIRMPRMDGITLAHAALQRKPNIIIIFMSSYDDKEYLKSAIDLRVLGYLEKPFQLRQVEALLQKAVDEITSVRQLSAINTDSMFQNNIQDLSDITTSLSHYQNSYDSVTEELRQKKPDFLGQNYYVSVLIHAISDRVDAQIQDIPSLYQEVYQFFKENNIAGLLTETKKPYVLMHLAAADRKIISWIIMEFYNRLTGWLPNLKIRIATGSVVCSYKYLYQSYQESTVCMERHFFYNIPVLFSETFGAKIYNFTDEMTVRFKTLLELKDKKGCYAFINQLKRNLLAHDHTLSRNIKNHYFQLILLIMEYMPAKQENRENNSDYYLWETIFYIDSLEKLNEYVIDLLDIYFADNQKNNIMNRNIDSIINYIQNHYADTDLSLTEIAEYHFISVPYLCMFFKEQTGKTIKSFLIDYRMEKAADLLLHSDLRIMEISERTGFSDQNYFAKRFSKYYGQTPSKYKENRH